MDVAEFAKIPVRLYARRFGILANSATAKTRCSPERDHRSLQDAQVSDRIVCHCHGVSAREIRRAMLGVDVAACEEWDVAEAAG